ncbi:MAG: DNA-directed RNA polymerase subunit alpha [Thermoanaerobaculia bacterium]
MRWKGFQRPKSVEIDGESLTPTYGKFIAQPLERGFATTIGNAMRRCLLSSIEGAAVTAVQIEGVLHEFSSMPGVVEDVTDVILNLKGIPLKLHGDEARVITLEARGAGDVTAGQFNADPQVEICDPDAPIATLNEEGVLKLQARVALGRGYVSAEKNFDESMGIGWIPVDSVHSPVKRVNYRVEAARLGRTTDYERLILEIWTNGTVSPDEALSLSASLLREHLAIFVQAPEEIGAGVEAEGEASPMDELLARTVDELDLETRTLNSLKNANILTLRDLIARSEGEVLETKGFGQKSLEEVQTVLADLGLKLGMQPGSGA